MESHSAASTDGANDSMWGPQSRELNLFFPGVETHSFIHPHIQKRLCGDNSCPSQDWETDCETRGCSCSSYHHLWEESRIVFSVSSIFFRT